MYPALCGDVSCSHYIQLAIARHFDGPGVPANAVAPAHVPPPVLPSPVDSEEDVYLVDPNIVVNDAKTGAIVPLSGLKVAARVNQTVADVSLSLRFENPSPSHPIEAVFRLADEDIIVHDFEVCVGDSIVQGQCMEKSEAFAKYDDAISSGNQAFLAEKKSKRQTFDISAGNLAPGMVCVVNVRYLTKLDTVGDAFVFGLPAARTVPPPASAPARVSDSDEEANAKLRAQVPNGLNITVAITQPQRIVDLKCETHKCDIERLDISGRVTLSQEHVSPARFEVSITVQDPNQPCCITEAVLDSAGKDVPAAAPIPSVVAPPQNEQVFDFGSQPGMSVVVPMSSMEVEEPVRYKKYALSLSVVPRIQSEIDISAEIVFMLDCSGSMSGGRMRRAKSALALFLRALPESCTFNIMAFGDRYHKLFDAPRRYNGETLEQANAWLATIDANLGGTNLLSPFEDLLSSPLSPSFPVRQVFLLTDGDVKNKSDVLHCVRTKIGEATRIFALGIGNEVSQALMRGIAKFGRGKAEFVESTTTLEAPVMRQVKRALQPVLTKFEIDWNTLRPSTKLAEIHFPPAIFDGERFDLHAFFDAPMDKWSGETTSKTRHEIKIRAMAEQQVFEFPCIVDLSASDMELSVQRFAAYAEIRDMELSPNHLGLKKNIIELATKYHLASKYTSFVAVHVSKSHVTEGHMIHMDVDEAISDSKAKDVGILAHAGGKLEEIGSALGGLLRTSGNYMSSKFDQLAAMGVEEEERYVARKREGSVGGGSNKGYAFSEEINDSLMAKGGMDDSDGLDSSSEDEDTSVVRVSDSSASESFKRRTTFSAPAAATDFAEKVVSFGAAVAEKVENLFGAPAPARAAAPPAPTAALVSTSHLDMGELHSGKPQSLSRQTNQISPRDSMITRGERLVDLPEEKKGKDKKSKDVSAGGRSNKGMEKEVGPKWSSRAAAGPPPPPPGQSYPPETSTSSSMAHYAPSMIQAIPQAMPAKPAPAKNAMLPLPSKASSAMDIVIHAQANGGFQYGAVIAALLGKTLQELDAKRPAEVSDELWATALAIAALEKLFAATKDEWSLVATKARKYVAKLAAAHPTAITVEAILEAATAAI